MRARVRRSTSRTRSATPKRRPYAFLSAAGLALFAAAVAVGLWSTGGAGTASAGVGTLNAPTNVAVEESQRDVPYYYEHFYGREHSNYIGEHERLGPLVLSVLDRCVERLRFYSVSSPLRALSHCRRRSTAGPTTPGRTAP